MTRPKIAAHSSGSATSNALTFAHTAASGNNTRLFVATTTTGAPSPNGCTYGGVAMDELTHIYNTDNEIRVYMLDAPTPGADDVVGSFSGSSAVSGIAITLKDCEPQTTAFEPYGDGAFGTHDYQGNSDTFGNPFAKTPLTGGNDLVLVFAVLNAAVSPLPTAPARIVTYVDAPGGVSRLALLKRTSIWPGPTTPVGFTVPNGEHYAVIHLCAVGR